jgi:K+-dependent Na+/Ca+ exchanger-like protein
MTLILHSLILIAAFYAIARICDKHFIPSLDYISRRLGLSHDAAGATLMAVGSSASELFVAIIALVKPGEHGSLGAGTIVGSAIFNLLVIIGASVIVRQTTLKWHSVFRDVFFYGIAIALLYFTFRDGIISLNDSIIFIAVYIIYVFTVIKWKKIVPDQPKDKPLTFQQKRENIRAKIVELAHKLIDKFFPKEKQYSTFIFSILAIALISWVIVESAIEISLVLNVPEAIIGLTVIAIGSSIPDLLSSVIVSKQGRNGMAISNAIGSNIFDILFGLGLPWLMVILIKGSPVTVETSDLHSSVLVLFLSLVAIFLIMLINKWKLGKKSGILLISLYLAYIVWTIFL